MLGYMTGAGFFNIKGEPLRTALKPGQKCIVKFHVYNLAAGDPVKDAWIHAFAGDSETKCRIGDIEPGFQADFSLIAVARDDGNGRMKIKAETGATSATTQIENTDNYSSSWPVKA